MKKLVSVVIRTWNREEDLKETLTVLKNVRYEPLEIVVVDNGSTDNTVSMVNSNFSEVKLIKLPKNVGIAATNIGIEKANGEYIFILDDDSQPQADSISLAIDKFSENSKIGIIAFKTIDYPSGFSPQLKFEKGNKEIKKGIKVKIFRGCGSIIKREVMEKVGGFPEEFFWIGEESDLAFRALNAGYEIRYFPELIVIHKVSSKNRILSVRTYYETRNIIWLYWKYSPIVLACLKTIFSVFNLGIKALRNKVGVYYFKALLDGLKGLPSVIKQRKVVYVQTCRSMFFSFIDRVFSNR